MDGTPRGFWLASVVASLVLGCASSPAVVLVEGVNGAVDATPVYVKDVAEKQEWRNGKRVKIRYATILVHEARAKEIERHYVSEGDGVILGGVTYTVVSIEPGAVDARARVSLQRIEE